MVPAAPRAPLALHPTSSSWLDQFACITADRIRRGVLTGVPQLERAIADYLAGHNANPEPFTRTATADFIRERLKRVCERTSDSGQ